MMKRYCILSVLLILMFIPGKCRANNISVTSSTLKGGGGVDARLSFDVSWDNSWRIEGDTSFWDAAWLFVKYRLAGNTTWYHLKLNADGHRAPSGSELALGKPDEKSAWNADTNPYVGAFLHRSSKGTGSVDYTDVELAFNLAYNNLVSTNTIDTRVFAIEMVYISTGSFYVGSGGAEYDHFFEGGGSAPFLIDSEGEITVADTAGNLYYTNDYGAGGDRGDPIPAAFPKGYGSFYMMKYSITQGQYVDFLNTLTRTQQAYRFVSTTVDDYMYSSIGRTTPAYRNGVQLTSDPGSPDPRVYSDNLDEDTNYNESVDGECIACNYISWADGIAYAAWSGLRPFTELEYEKACRGPLSAVADEYAWGTDTIADSVYTLENEGAANEGIDANYSATDGNASYSLTDGSIDGPLRVGIFAANAGNTGRISAGSAYWGIMELSGNLWERSVTVGNSDGRNFTGLHGDGELTSGGDADIASLNWPAFTGSGAGLRGGSWGRVSTSLRVSIRERAALTDAVRLTHYGFRAARSAPASAGE